MAEDIELLTRRQAANLLGISVRTIDRYVTQRLVQFIKYPSGVIRFKRSDLLKWIEKMTVRANPFAA